jgi:multiple sugar transport system substrate-binding protein
MPQGVAGMIFEGEFTLPIWVRDNPDFDFGVSPIPTQTATVTPLGYQNTGTNHQWVYAKSKYPEVAAEIFRYLGTKEGQTAFVNITGGSDPSIFTDVNENAQVDPRMRTVYGIYEKYMRLCPDVRIRNPETSQIFLRIQKPTPSLGEVIQGIYTGQLDDSKAAMQDLKDRSERALDDAIAEAQADGVTVSRDDYVFPNWDPTRDYLEADYAELG